MQSGLLHSIIPKHSLCDFFPCSQESEKSEPPRWPCIFVDQCTWRLLYSSTLWKVKSHWKDPSGHPSQRFRDFPSCSPFPDRMAVEVLTGGMGLVLSTSWVYFSTFETDWPSTGVKVNLTESNGQCQRLVKWLTFRRSLSMGPICNLLHLQWCHCWFGVW